EHRGRISVAPADVDRVAAELPPGRWQAELGVGTIRVAVETAEQLATTRALAHEHGGWLLREAGGRADDDGFGVPLPNRDVARRIKDAFDPDGKCNPGRLPL